MKLGILGGGQLGRFLVRSASEWGIHCSVLDPDSDAAASKICPDFHTGSLLDAKTVLDFAHGLDAITIEIENVNADALEEIEKSKTKVRPGASLVKLVQDKGLQKKFYLDHNFPTAEFILIENAAAIAPALSAAGWARPVIQKLRRGGYDGRGVLSLNVPDQKDRFDAPSVIEKKIEIESEIAIIVSRNSKGNISAYPPVEMVFDGSAHILDYLISPAQIDPVIAERASTIATDLAEGLKLEGILAVEMFITKSGSLLVNEIAPRPHNSGHGSIEGNHTSQYEQLVRAIFDYSPGATDQVMPSLMLNLIGTGDGPVAVQGLDSALSIPGVYVHLYGKTICKPGRKMGHVTVLGKDRQILIDRMNTVRRLLKVTSV